MKIIFKCNYSRDVNYISQAEKLWEQNFNEKINFAKYFINEYSGLVDYVFSVDGDVLASMAFIVNKKILYNGKIINVNLIVGVATNKSYSRKGLMANAMNIILDKYDNLFIQSEHWEFYSKWDFFNTTNEYEYDVVESPLDELESDSVINWNLIVEEFNKTGSVQYDSKSFKEYISMFKILDGKIIARDGDFALFEGQKIFEYNYKDIDIFLRLIKKYSIKKILSSVKINHPNFINEKNVVLTKSVKCYKDLIFNTHF